MRAYEADLRRGSCFQAAQGCTVPSSASSYKKFHVCNIGQRLRSGETGQHLFHSFVDRKLSVQWGNTVYHIPPEPVYKLEFLDRIFMSESCVQRQCYTHVMHEVFAGAVHCLAVTQCDLINSPITCPITSPLLPNSTAQEISCWWRQIMCRQCAVFMPGWK